MSSEDDDGARRLAGAAQCAPIPTACEPVYFLSFRLQISLSSRSAIATLFCCVEYTLLHPFQIANRFGKSRYINFTMYLVIVYISSYIAKSMYLYLPKL
jgi:hypothetical protein